MHCSQCGQQIDTDSKFCRFCGSSQSAVSFSKPEALANSSPDSGLWKAVPGWAKAALVIILLVVLISLFNTPAPPTAQDVADDALANALDKTGENLEGVASPVDDRANDDPWSYSTSQDKVRGSTTYFASNSSTNTIRQDAPYDPDTRMTITLRKSPAYGVDVIISISSGQLMCPSYEGCSGTVRFDSGKAESVSFAGSADNSSDTIFIIGAKSFIAKLKRAKRVVIEKTLYEAGAPQFEFDVSGLKWPH